MKKILAIMAVAAMALVMVACGSKNDTKPKSTPADKPGSTASSTANTPASTPAEGGDVVVDFSESFVGLTSAGEAVCLAYNDDFSLCVLIAVNEAGEYASFVGPGTDNGDGTMTITDETNELALTFGVTQLESGNFSLDMGDLGTAEVAPCAVDEVIKMMNEIDANGTAVA